MSGLTILSATYGTSSTSTDVTSSVTSLVQDGVLNLSVSPFSLNVDDPAPGQIKTLKVNYSINGGSSTLREATDGGSININAPPERHASGLQIKKAEYGVDGNMTDVSDALRGMISNGSINLTVGFKQVGLPDPNPQKQKHLQITYTINGAENSRTLKDGQTLNISAPAVSAPSGTTPVQNSFNLLGSIYKGVAEALGFFLQAMSVGGAFEFGNANGGYGYVLGGIAFIIPFFSFWALPLIILVMRMFYETDFPLPVV